MIAAALQIVPQAWPALLQPHPWAVGFFILVGGVLFAYSFASRKRSEVESSFEGNLISGDNSGIQIGHSIIGDNALEKILKASSPPTGTVCRLHIQTAEYVSIDDPKRSIPVTDCLRQLVEDDKLIFEVQNHNFVANGKNYVPKDPHPNHKKKLHVVYSFNGGPLREVIEREESTLSIPQPLSSPKSTSPKLPLPVLELSFGASLVAVEDHTVDFAESDGVKCYSIHVHNRLAAIGGQASRADSISARITFKHEGSSQKTFVDRCCWIGKQENEIYLSPGDTAQVLCGIQKNMEWTTYMNPNQTAPGDWGHYKFLKKVVVSLFAGARIHGNISIATHRNNQSMTLATRNFVISVDNVGVALKLRWDDEA